MNRLVPKLIMLLGIIGLLFKFIEPYLITKGCFGYDYLYEFSSLIIPILLVILGCWLNKKLHT